MRTRIAVGLALIASISPDLRAQSTACDRQCLTETLTGYLNAMVGRNPAAAPLAANVRFTEDGAPLKIGEGLWKSQIKFGAYRLDFIDVQQGTAAVHTLFEDNGKPLLFAGRLKVVDRKITEVETMVVRSQAEAMLFAPANLTAPTAAMTYRPQPSERMAREQMLAIAARYPAGLRAGSFVKADVPMAPNAYRFENGVRMAGPGCTFQPPSCENMKTQSIPTLPDVKERLVAVDEEMGIVLFRLDFGRGSLPGPANAAKTLVTFEAFKVFGGMLHAAEAVFESADLNAASGWD
jgi:hypothetical protein